MKRWIAPAASIVLAIVFAAAALPKILAPHDFALAIYRYQILPFALVNIMAVYLPWIEIFSAAGLFVPRIRRGAALILFVLLAVFAVAIAAGIFRGINIACGCFSVSEEASDAGWLNVARNLGLMVLAVLAGRNREEHALRR